MSGDKNIQETVEEILKKKLRTIATHVGKFSHPDAKTNIFVKVRGSSYGLLKSGSVRDIELDSPGDAATLGIAKFMFEKLEDGRSVYEHLQQNTEKIRNLLSVYGSEYDSIRSKLLKLLVVPKSAEESSSSELKQVYFPVNDKYHLLSVLVPVGIVLSMHDQLKEMRFSDVAKKSREARAKGIHSNDSRDIWKLTTISYGGANAQNISYLATKLKGYSLLPCFPPEINERVRLPRRNFFTDVLRVKNYEEIFCGFHKLQASDWNKKEIRQGRDRWVISFLDRVMGMVWRIRAEEHGWSDRENYTSLPSHQRKWLDNKYSDERETSDFDVHAVKIADELAHWFMRGYDKILGSKKVLLGDDFLRHVRGLINIEELR